MGTSTFEEAEPAYLKQSFIYHGRWLRFVALPG